MFLLQKQHKSPKIITHLGKVVKDSRDPEFRTTRIITSFRLLYKKYTKIVVNRKQQYIKRDIKLVSRLSQINFSTNQLENPSTSGNLISRALLQSKEL